MTNPLDVPGLAAFRGKGVWLEMPAEVPASLRDGHAVVIGDVDAAAAAALRLHDGGCRVTVLAAGFSATDIRTLRRTVRGRAGIDVRLHTELACVDGIGHVEALVMRRRGCRCVDACNASAIFILNSQEKHSPGHDARGSKGTDRYNSQLVGEVAAAGTAYAAESADVLAALKAAGRAL